MPLHLKFTERGFVRGDFIDRYGEPCSIQKSSLATEDCIWLGCDEPKVHHVTGNVLGRMHLTQEMAADLIPLLQAFVETGDLPVPPDHSDT